MRLRLGVRGAPWLWLYVEGLRRVGADPVGADPVGADPGGIKNNNYIIHADAEATKKNKIKLYRYYNTTGSAVYTIPPPSGVK